MSNRRRHVGSRDAPETSNCLGVFGLSLYTTERELEKEFSKFGPLEKVTVVLDGKVTQLYMPFFSILKMMKKLLHPVWAYKKRPIRNGQAIFDRFLVFWG